MCTGMELANGNKTIKQIRTARDRLSQLIGKERKSNNPDARSASTINTTMEWLGQVEVNHAELLMSRTNRLAIRATRPKRM